MAIIKSRKLAFIIKLVLLFPLSYITVCTAACLTGGGHGNFLPLILILGPLNILEQNMGTFLFLVIPLYEVYALLIRFIKSNYTLALILTLHVASGLIEILINSNSYSAPLVHPIAVILLVPLAFVIWIFVSIDKSRKEEL